MNVNLNGRNWDQKYFSHVTHALYVLEIIIDVHKIENQIIKEFDRFISIFSINLEFFVVVDLNVFRHCSIEVKTKSIFWPMQMISVRASRCNDCSFQMLCFLQPLQKRRTVSDSVDFVIRYAQCIKRRLNFY